MSDYGSGSFNTYNATRKLTANIPSVNIQSVEDMDSANEEEVAEYGMLPAFIMSLNFIIGAGFFSMPYVFYHGGIMWGVLTLFLVTITLIITSNWTLEACSRAQALETVIEESGIPDLTFQDVSIVGKRGKVSALLQPHRKSPLITPKYEITKNRKFEFTELMEVFFGKPGRVITASLTMIYLFVTLVGYSTIFSSTLSLVIPLDKINPKLGACNITDYAGLLPSGLCLNSYRVSSLIYACIVIPMSAMNVNTLKPFQIGLSFTMQGSVLLAISHCIYELAVGNINGPTPDTHYDTRLFAFDFKNFLNMVPIVLYSQVLHEGIPMLAQPARNKKNLHVMFGGALTFSCMVYSSFSVMAALRYREDVAPIASLNWNISRQAGNAILVRIISYLVMMTPSVVVCSAFPLYATTFITNFIILVTGKDYSLDPAHKGKLKILSALTSIIPIAIGLFISNLQIIAKYAGLIGFMLILFIPIMLQVQSRKKCRRVFGQVDQWIEESIAASIAMKEEDRRSLLDKYAMLRDVMTMCPYYSSWWSRTWVVVIVTIFSTVLFCLGCVSAFITK